MKRLFTLFTAVIITASIFSQAPNKMSYQSVVRNAIGVLVQSSNVGIKISLLQSTATGTVVYSETHIVTTNVNGLATLEIGGGSVVSGIFANIDWSAGPYFIKTETDPTGGTNYTITGISQMLSVPYSLYAAKSGTPGPQGPSGILTPGSVAGNTPFWNGSAWITDNSNIYNNGGNIGIGTSTPSSKFDISGGNNWDLKNGEGDFRLGNSQYRLKAGVALGGGGAGAVGIMQYGQPGGYNVLSIGAQGNYLLFLNGGTQRVGIGTDNPGAALEISSTTQGFLPPRMTQGQRDLIASVEGLLVYNTTTKKPNYYDGSEWKNYDGTTARSPAVGDSYQGGIISYILQPGDAGYDSNVQHGLIAAPSDQSAGTSWWGCFGTTISGADGIIIGTGNQNTIDIINGCSTAGIAAKSCSDLVLNGYSDWYLPSKDELNKLYINKTSIGGFASNAYWSSSERDSGSAWYEHFSNGFQNYSNKNMLFYVRAIRAF